MKVNLTILFAGSSIRRLLRHLVGVGPTTYDRKSTNLAEHHTVRMITIESKSVLNGFDHVRYALPNRPSFSMLVRGTQKSFLYSIQHIFLKIASLRLPKVRKLEN